MSDDDEHRTKCHKWKTVVKREEEEKKPKAKMYCKKSFSFIHDVQIGNHKIFFALRFFFHVVSFLCFTEKLFSIDVDSVLVLYRYHFFLSFPFLLFSFFFTHSPFSMISLFSRCKCCLQTFKERKSLSSGWFFFRFPETK